MIQAIGGTEGNSAKHDKWSRKSKTEIASRIILQPELSFRCIKNKRLIVNPKTKIAEITLMYVFIHL